MCKEFISMRKVEKGELEQLPLYPHPCSILLASVKEQLKLN